MSKMKDSHADLTALVRDVSRVVNDGDESTAREQAQRLRDAGFVRDEHVGADPATMTPETALAWYAGQFIAMVEDDAWFGINSWINCTDKFAPAVSP